MFHPTGRAAALGACAAWLLLGLSLFACGGEEEPDEAGLPAVSGPIEGGLGRPFYAGLSYDLAEQGYRESEYFVEGTASAYTPLGELGVDGRWSVGAGEQAAFHTRVLVAQPNDPAAFSGTVVVEWLNVSGGVDAAPDWTMLHTALMRRGDAWVGVSAQRIGIEGGKSLVPIDGAGDASLKGRDPLRYGVLSHPGDSFSYDMFTQVGRLVRAGRLPGLAPRTVIAIGESQSAFRMVTYVNAIDPIARVFDGFLIHSRAGAPAPLSQEPQVMAAGAAGAQVRADVRVPVLTFQTETDVTLLSAYRSRREDGPNYRLWETAGTAHADLYTLSRGRGDRGDDPAVFHVIAEMSPMPGSIECDQPVNAGPQHYLLRAAMTALIGWVETGVAPASAPRLALAGMPPALVLDGRGIATGGIRSPDVDAPVAVLSGLGQSGKPVCSLFGTTALFDVATFNAQYPTQQAYVDAVKAATDLGVAAGHILSADAMLLEAAAATFVPGG